jgi:hypothetical protein
MKGQISSILLVGEFEIAQKWSEMINQFAILFEGRVPMGGLSSNSLIQNPV